MIVSRALILSKNTRNMKNLLLENSNNNLIKQVTRNAHEKLYYRQKPAFPSDDFKLKIATGVIWWWVLWHFYKDFEELLSPVFPDPSSWTDEELGIPPDDFD